MNIKQDNFSVLGAMPGTKAELMHKTRLTQLRTSNAIRSLRKTHQAYIGGMLFSGRGGPQIPIYWAGQGKDVEEIIAPVLDSEQKENARLAKSIKRVDKHIASLAGTKAQWFYSLPNARA